MKFHFIPILVDGFGNFLRNFDEILSGLQEYFQKMMKCLEILLRTSRKMRKKAEKSGIGEKFHPFHFFQSYPYRTTPPQFCASRLLLQALARLRWHWWSWGLCGARLCSSGIVKWTIRAFYIISSCCSSVCHNYSNIVYVKNAWIIYYSFVRAEPRAPEPQRLSMSSMPKKVGCCASFFRPEWRV